VVAKHEVNLRAGERRVALAKRRRVGEMSPEEMQRELLTSEVTGLPNRRAFNEARGSTCRRYVRRRRSQSPKQIWV